MNFIYSTILDIIHRSGVIYYIAYNHCIVIANENEERFTTWSLYFLLYFP